MSPALRLALSELVASARSWELRLLLLFALGAGALAGRPDLVSALGDRWEDAWRDPPGPDTPEPLCRPGEGQARAVAAVGEVPGWFSWHEPLVDPAAADVVLVFQPAPRPDPDERWSGALRVEALGQRDEAEVDAVVSCVRAQLRDERRARLDALGVPETPRRVAEVQILDAAAPADPARDLPVAGLGLLTVLALGALTWAYEALPGARQRGWLETLASAGVSPGAVSAAFAGVGAAWALANGLAFGLGGALSGELPDARWLALPLVALLFSALSVRAFITVPDMRASAFRSMWIPLVIMAVGGLAVVVERRWGLGGLVPVGGLLLPWLGEVSVGSRAAGLALALPVAALAVGSAAGVLRRDGALGVGADPTAARRARGAYGPEATLLVLLALAGLSVAIAPVGGGPAVQLAVGQVLFLILPAMLAPGLLGLPARELLQLQAPSARAWLALPGVILGTLSGGLLATWLQARVLPDNPFQALQYGDAVGAISGGLAILVPTLGAGLSEELLFRGAVLGLLRRGRGLWAALLLQALAFALLHVLAFKLLPTGVIGLVLGVLALRSGSVWPGVLAHALHNGLALVLGMRLLEVFDPARWPDWGPAAAAAGLGLGLGAAWWSGSARQDR